MINAILGRRHVRLTSNFEHYLRNLERRSNHGLPTIQEARRDYRAAMRSRHLFLPQG